jgi:hypothetical protein
MVDPGWSSPKTLAQPGQALSFAKTGILTPFGCAPSEALINLAFHGYGEAGKPRQSSGPLVGMRNFGRNHFLGGVIGSANSSPDYFRS